MHIKFAAKSWQYWLYELKIPPLVQIYGLKLDSLRFHIK